MKKVGIVGLMVLLLLTGCKDKSQEAYQKGLAEASTAFEVQGNTELDQERVKDNLGLTAEKKKKQENKRATEAAQESQEESLAEAAKEGTKYKYAVNTDTFIIHSVDCEDVDLKRPTFRVWKDSLEAAEAQGYSRHSECLGN